MNLRKLEKKEIRLIFKKINEYYGVSNEIFDELIKNFNFYSNKKGKIYIVEKKLAHLLSNKDINKFINKYGLYIVSLDKYGIRFSIEGLHMFGPYIKKNIIDVNYNDLLNWFSRKDLIYKESCNGYVVLKYKNYYIGCGLCKNGIIKNFLSKDRVVTFRDISKNLQ